MLSNATSNISSGSSGNNGRSDSDSVVHKLRLCFAYSGSYTVFPLVRVNAVCSSAIPTTSVGHSVESSSVTSTNVDSSNSSVGDSSWWTATGSYIFEWK